MKQVNPMYICPNSNAEILSKDRISFFMCGTDTREMNRGRGMQNASAYFANTVVCKQKNQFNEYRH